MFKNNFLTTTVHAKDLMEGMTPNEVSAIDDLSKFNASARDFAIRLLKESNVDQENILLSPLSVMYALSMTVNGAEGETRRQMEEALGMSAEELNIYLYSYMNSLYKKEPYKISIANSIWINDDSRFTANQSFLQTNADYFGADIYKTEFNNRAVDDINNWASNKTDGMIPKVVDKIPRDAVMYLINTLLFEAEWSTKYIKTDVSNAEFTKEDGTKQKTKLMYSTEHAYIEDENAVGFVKSYNYGRYAFVALLPNEGITVSEYLSTLDGSSVSKMFENQRYATIDAAIPKFEVEYDSEMSSILKSMGINDAFDSFLADFDGIGESKAGNIYINRVVHKTHIQMTENGTKAGAVASVEMTDGAELPEPDDVKRIHLNRPFVYMIIDRENNVPLFIGTMMDVNG